MITGKNAYVIWEFGGGLFAFYLLVAVISMGISAIRQFLSNI
jgi:hypothetical protein